MPVRAEQGHKDTRWRKSSFSAGGSCVEVGQPGSGIAVRDTMNVAGGQLAFSADVWKGAMNAIKGGKFPGAQGNR